MAATHALVVAISGCSSSGKTTLARLLRDIFPHTFILHEDDFYRPEEELPSKDGLLDWDCAESLDIPSMAESLAYIRKHAAFPPTLDSKEDQNSIGKCPVSDATIEAQKAKVAAAIPASHPLRSSLRLCVLDGFLLYSPAMAAIQPSLDIKLFLRASHARARARREARDGYVTLEGFWADPPGYVDKIVWPNYVKEHAWMFEGGDVEGGFRKDVLDKEGIKFQKDAAVDADISKTLEWTVDVILEELKHSV
ncbi:P-loop containing nucleoside triphosphate hydrolase protein [Dactylonectria estremocensis]|uniref:P-loop containing nucleoside triphosphate hydrolase protein n=1 Tax=Dactylonectria estremocensis TaxID=1079267 RepID=A0A9P9F076_9HYPO|nr:P-loop containing nucleoside triphosphate hydrolase protein [Dactylonectria estremocensis]